MNSFRPLSPTSATCGTNPERPRRAPRRARASCWLRRRSSRSPPRTPVPWRPFRRAAPITLCAHANAMPFSSRREEPPGFQIELARALARHLGVELAVAWVVTPNQYRTAECDIVLDTIVDEDVLAQTRLRVSRPYQRSGVAIALPANATEARSFDDLERGRPIGVQVGSVAQMVLSQRGLTTVPFAFEDDIVEEVSAGRIAGGAVSAATVGYFNLKHPDRAHPTGSRLRARARPRHGTSPSACAVPTLRFGRGSMPQSTPCLSDGTIRDDLCALRHRASTAGNAMKQPADRSRWFGAPLFSLELRPAY